MAEETEGRQCVCNGLVLQLVWRRPVGPNWDRRWLRPATVAHIASSSPVAIPTPRRRSSVAC
jgi:hypothetical protein